MLIGLNAIKTVNRTKAPVLDAWFDGDEQAPAASTASVVAVATVSAAKAMLASVQFHGSLKGMKRSQTEVPSLPRHAETAPAKAVAPVVSPYHSLSTILEPNSRSSSWLNHFGLMQEFASNECFVDMTMTPDGGMSAVLRSPSGYRRTVVCRPDGTSAQRVTGPRGEEILRFNNDGEPINIANKRENALAIA